MTEIYLAIRHNHYDDCTVLGVFSTYAAAEAFKQRSANAWGSEHGVTHYVETHVLDQFA